MLRGTVDEHRLIDTQRKEDLWIGAHGMPWIVIEQGENVVV